MNENIKKNPTAKKDYYPEAQTPKSLGALLVKRGLITDEELQKALSIQRKEKRLQKLPIGQILVELKLLSQDNVNLILNHPELRSMIGELAVEKGFLKKEQVNKCLEKKRPEQLLGQVFLNAGLISSQDLETLITEQLKSSRFGELAVSLDLVKREDIIKAFKIQAAPRRLGEILCDLDLIDPLTLNQCMTEGNKQLELGTTLIDLGMLTKEQLHIVNEDLKYGEDTLSDILIKKRLITEEELQVANSKHYNIPFEALRGFVYADKEKQNLIKIISKKYAETKLIIPISFYKDRLKVGLFRPAEQLKDVYELKNMYRQYNITTVLVTKEKFEELFEILYSTYLSGKKTDEEDELLGGETIEMDFMSLTIDEDIGKKEIKKATVYDKRDVEAEEVVSFIISYGIVHGASDIHIEQSSNGVKLRYRFDGLLRENNIGWLKEKLEEKAAGIISRIKVLAGLDITEKRAPQDGSFRTEFFDKDKKEKIDLDFRVATCRAAVGENVTIRILDPRNANVGLESLNHSSHVLVPFQQFLKSPGGMILVCGPTGCGKTSTLYGALQYIDKPDIKIITAEDPIEYHFPTIMQTQVNPKIDLSFSRLLRSFLRFDPDVILIGEIRDLETTKIAFDAAQTGHLILSTLHTTDALSSINRLLDLEAEYGQIASSLMCVLSQRLVRKICTSCIEEYSPTKEEWGVLFDTYPTHLRFFKGRGCEICSYSGFKGRTLLSEIFAITSEISKSLHKGYDESYIAKLAIESGMKTMLDDGLLKLNQTTISEIVRMLPHDMIKKFKAKQHSQRNIDFIIESMTEGSEEISEKRNRHIPSVVEISNPEIEIPKLDLLLSMYEAASGDQNVKGNRIQPGLFKDFIVDCFYKVYLKHPCEKMVFSVDKNQESGKLEILINPVL